MGHDINVPKFKVPFSMSGSERLAEPVNNLVPNPRAAVNTTVPFNTFNTLGRVDLPDTAAGIGPDGVLTAFRVVGTAGGQRLTFADLPVITEAPYPFKVWVYIVSLTASGVILRIRRSSDQALMVQGDLLSTVGVWLQDVWVRHPENDQNETFSIEQSGAGGVEAYAYAMVNDYEPPGWAPEDQVPYFDGSTDAGTEWLGTPHLSASRRLWYPGDRSRAAVVEQDSTDEVFQCVRSLVKTPVGARIDEPEYGIPDYVFRNGTDFDALTAAIDEWEPRAEYELEADDIRDIAQTVHIDIEARE